MKKIIRDEYGYPIHVFASNAIISSVDVPTKAAVSATRLDTIISIGGYRCAPWGISNDYPQIAEGIINKSTVLGAALRFKKDMILAQGIYVYKITGYADNGEPQRQVIFKPYVSNFMNSRMVRTYLECAIRDNLKFGTAFPALIPAKSGKKIIHIYAKNAFHCRYEIQNNGVIQNVIYCGSLPLTSSEVFAIPCLDPDNPEFDMQLRAVKGLIKEFIYPIKDNFSNSTYYGLPAWETARQAGWLDIAAKIPKFISSMYENQISPKYHIQIPYRLWERKFPASKFTDPDERMQLIEDYITKFEAELTSPEKARKTIVTMFELNEKGEAEEKITITPIDEKWTNENLITSAVANAEIFYAEGLNPDMAGMGMAGGGPYSSSSGGSNIREAYLIATAHAWTAQQRILDPLEAMLRYNGDIAEDEQIGFQKTILTTLDTGAGTAKVVS